MPAPDFQNQNANANLIKVTNNVVLWFFLAGRSFEETFINLPTMGMVLIRMSFFENYSVTNDVKNQLIHLPDFSVQKRKKSNEKNLNKIMKLRTTQKMVITSFQQVMIPVRIEITYGPTNGAVKAPPAFERRDALLVSTALVTLTEGKTKLQINKPHSHTYALDSCEDVANFKVMKPQQAANTKPVPHALVLLMNNHPEECEHILSQLFQEQTENDGIDGAQFWRRVMIPASWTRQRNQFTMRSSPSEAKSS